MDQTKLTALVLIVVAAIVAALKVFGIDVPTP